MPLGPIPTVSPYSAIPDEHLPWGVDTPHNLTPMPLFPTQTANGVARPPRLVNKNRFVGNPLKIFRAFAAPIGSQPAQQ